MKRNKVNTQQTKIILLSTLVFLFVVGKYIFMPDTVPVAFLMIELVSVMAILFLLFYADRSIKRLSKTKEKLKDENQSLNKMIEHLKSELEGKSNTSTKKLSTNNTIESITDSFKNLPNTKDDNGFYNSILAALTKNFEFVIALFFVYNEQSKSFSVEGNYGIQKDEPVTPFVIGEGLHGEAINEKKVMVLEDLPEEYFLSYSGLGESKPKYLYVLPIADKENVIGVIEIASFKPLDLEDTWNSINKKLIELITVR